MALARVLLVVLQLWIFGPSAVPPSEAADTATASAASGARQPARGAAALPYTISARSKAVRTLLQTIPVMPFGAPATNATVDPQLARDIELQAVALEQGTRSVSVWFVCGCVGVWVCGCVCVCVYVCLCVRVWVCMCVCVCVCVMHACICVCVCMYVCMYVCIYVCI